MKQLTKEEADANWEAFVASRQPKTEHALQTMVVNYCRSLVGRELVKERFAAIPNGAFLAGNPSRRAGQMAKLKAEGLRPGFPDLVLWRYRILGEYTRIPEVLWMELKNGKAGRVSDEQKAVHASLRECGFTVLVVRTLDEAKTAINEFYT